MKIELTKEQAEHMFKCIADQDDNFRLCARCDFGNGDGCIIRDDNEVDILHAAARVLYSTLELDRVDIAKYFVMAMLSNGGLDDEPFYNVAHDAFSRADVFIEAAEKGKTK